MFTPFLELHKLPREYEEEAMLIKRENKNQNKQCGAVNPVHEYLIFYRQFQEIG